MCTKYQGLFSITRSTLMFNIMDSDSFQLVFCSLILSDNDKEANDILDIRHQKILFCLLPG